MKCNAPSPFNAPKIDALRNAYTSYKLAYGSAIAANARVR